MSNMPVIKLLARIALMQVNLDHRDSESYFAIPRVVHSFEPSPRSLSSVFDHPT